MGLPIWYVVVVENPFAYHYIAVAIFRIHTVPANSTATWQSEKWGMDLKLAIGS